MVSNIPFGSYQPDRNGLPLKRTPHFSVGISEIALHPDFFCSFGSRGKKKTDYRDKGRGRDRRLAKRKKSVFDELWIFSVIRHLK